MQSSAMMAYYDIVNHACKNVTMNFSNRNGNRAVRNEPRSINRITLYNALESNVFFARATLQTALFFFLLFKPIIRCHPVVYSAAAERGDPQCWTSDVTAGRPCRSFCGVNRGPGACPSDGGRKHAPGGGGIIIAHPTSARRKRAGRGRVVKSVLLIMH